MRKLRTRIGLWLQWLTWRVLPYQEQPKLLGWSFTFENHKGVVFNQDGRGCPLMYFNDEEYERAHNEAIDASPRIDWKKLADGSL